MKTHPMSPFLFMTLCLAPLGAEEPASEADQVRQEAEKALADKLEARLAEAESRLKAGSVAGVDQLLAEALALDPNHARALELRKLCRDLSDKLEKLEDRQRDRRNFHPDPMDVVENNEKIGGRLAEAQRRQLASRLEKSLTPALAEKLGKTVSLKGAQSGSAAVDLLRKATGLNIVVDASLREVEGYKASPDLELEDVKAVSCLNLLARVWGAQWTIEDEAVVFSREGAQEPDIVPEGYTPEDCEKLDLGGLGLGGEPDAGLTPDGKFVVPVPRLKVRAPSGDPKVLVDEDGDIQIVIDPESVTSDGKKKP